MNSTNYIYNGHKCNRKIMHRVKGSKNSVIGSRQQLN